MTTSAASEDNSTTSYSASSAGRIAHGAAMVITQRLAESPDLALPSSLYKDAANPPAVASVLAYLQTLLDKDPAAFLARYGGLLQSQELNHFEALRSADYEVDHWLGHFATQRLADAQQAANPRRLPARVKNRRLAAMRRLAAEGEYFSEEAMRDRAPLLYHQQIGRFVQPQEEQQGQQEAEQGGGGGEEEAERRLCGGEGAGPSGSGMGGSCLASALRQALERSQGAGQAGPPGGAAVSLGEAAAPGPSRNGGGSAAAAHGGGKGGAGPGTSHEAVGSGGDAAMPDASATGRSGGGGGLPSAGARTTELRFSEFLMRQDDEAQLVRRRMQEQMEEDAQLSEHESDEEEDESGRSAGASDSDAMSDGRPRGHRGRHMAPSATEVAQMRRDFMDEMQSRFLLGQDAQYVDYGSIDADASLDGDWIEQESRDAEEKYFDED